MGAAFGGGATQQVFGGRGAGNILTRATAVCAGDLHADERVARVLLVVGRPRAQGAHRRGAAQGQGQRGNAREGAKLKPAPPPTDTPPAPSGMTAERRLPGARRDAAPSVRDLAERATVAVATRVAARRARSCVVDACVLRAGLHARLGRRLRAHGHRPAVRARAAPRPERHELAPLPLLDRRRGDGGASGGRSARRARSRWCSARSASPRRTRRCERRGVPRAAAAGGDRDRDGAPVERVARRRDGARGVDGRAHRRAARSRCRATRARPWAAARPPRRIAVALRGVAGLRRARALCVRASGARATASAPRRRRREARVRDRGPRRARALDGVERPRPRERASLRRARDRVPARHRRRGRRRWSTSCSATRARSSTRRPRPRPSGACGVIALVWRERAAPALAMGRRRRRWPSSLFLVVGRPGRRRADAPPRARARSRLVDPHRDGRRLAPSSRSQARAAQARRRVSAIAASPWRSQRRHGWRRCRPRWAAAPGQGDLERRDAQIARGLELRTQRRGGRGDHALPVRALRADRGVGRSPSGLVYSREPRSRSRPTVPGSPRPEDVPECGRRAAQSGRGRPMRGESKTAALRPPARASRRGGDGRLRDPPPDWPGRDGRGLRGARSRTPAPRGPEDAPPLLPRGALPLQARVSRARRRPPSQPGAAPRARGHAALVTRSSRWSSCGAPTFSRTFRGASARLRPALRQLVEGIRALHRAGTLHRDIKPSNVRVTPEGRVVLLDFGVATELAPATGDTANEPGETAGTARYMAPELAGGATSHRRERLVQRRDHARRGPRRRSGPPILDALRRDLVRRDPAERPDGAEIARRSRGSTSAAATLPAILSGGAGRGRGVRGPRGLAAGLAARVRGRTPGRVDHRARDGLAGHGQVDPRPPLPRRAR